MDRVVVEKRSRGSTKRKQGAGSEKWEKKAKKLRSYMGTRLHCQDAGLAFSLLSQGDNIYVLCLREYRHVAPTGWIQRGGSMPSYVASQGQDQP